jgi:hypothetical protein
MVFNKFTNKRSYKNSKSTNRRRFTNRKSKKYGGAFTDTEIMPALIAYLQSPPSQLTYVDSRDIVYGLYKDKLTFDGADVLSQLKRAVVDGRKRGNYDKTDIVLRKIDEIQKKAEREQPRKNELQDDLEKIEVFDILGGEEVSAFQFLEENKKHEPFIIRIKPKNYIVDAINWPIANPNGNQFIECLDDTPESFQGTNSYRQFIKPNARTFVKMTHYNFMVLKPHWYDKDYVPGSKVFKLVPDEPVLKFMTTMFTMTNMPRTFAPLRSEHCNQTSPTPTYRLEVITKDELKDIVASEYDTNEKARDEPSIDELAINEKERNEKEINEKERNEKAGGRKSKRKIMKKRKSLKGNRR